jgi:hypothetical protein
MISSRVEALNVRQVGNLSSWSKAPKIFNEIHPQDDRLTTCRTGDGSRKRFGGRQDVRAPGTETQWTMDNGQGTTDEVPRSRELTRRQVAEPCAIIGENKTQDREGDVTTQTQKVERFRELHRRAGAFVIPNAWDIGSARLLAGMGFEAVATTSVGFANAMGRLDGQMSRDDVLEHCRALSSAVDVPVSADLENCFADDPAGVAETIRLR